VHYYQFNVADFALHTSHLTLEEEGIYRRLLDYYYDTETPIPKETQSVIRRLRLVSYEVQFNIILNEFFVLMDDGWHNFRADIEISEYNKKADCARENGKKGGRPKKNKGLKTQSVILANQEETGSQANYKLLTINQELITNTKPTSPPKAAPCPTQKIIEIFIERCPSLIQPRVIPDSVKSMIADRWRQDEKHRNIGFWERYFDHCESIDFLTGRTKPTRGEKSFRVGLEWIVKAGNFAKIINGNYANG